MDIKREGVGRKKLIRSILLGIVAVAALGATTYGLSRLKPAAPNVEGATLWYGTAKKGEMVRQVRGLGTLVPQEILLVPAAGEGRVERRLMLPGTEVKAGSVIMELSNQELMTALSDAEWAVKAAEAELGDLRVKLIREKLEQKSKTAQTQSEEVQAKCCDERQMPLHGRASHFGFGAQSELVVVPAVMVEPVTSRPIAMPPQSAWTLGGVSSGDFVSGDFTGGKK